MDFIKKYNNYLSHEHCDYIINMLKDKTLNPGVTSGGKRQELKVSEDINLIEINDLTLQNEIIPAMREGITKALLLYNRDHPVVSNAMQVKEASEEDLLKVLQHTTIIDGEVALLHKWNKNEGFYHWHMDLGPTIRSSARILVCMYYLNDVKEGGETGFYYQNIENKPTKGSLVLFPADWTHLHRGNMPISNDKYICNFWLLRKNPLITQKAENWKHYENNI